MFSDLGTLRATLRDRLQPKLPTAWKIVDHIATPGEELTAVVYFEFTGFDSSANGQPMPPDQVAATVDVVVTTPRTDDDGHAESEVDDNVLRLVSVVVRADDLYFSTARKVRLETGVWAWRVSLTALTNITPSEGE